MNDLSRQLIAAQTNRRTIDPMSLRRWGVPFLIERPAVPVEPVSVKKER